MVLMFMLNNKKNRKLVDYETFFLKIQIIRLYFLLVLFWGKVTIVMLAHANYTEVFSVLY